MPDKEKVIKGLERCKLFNKDNCDKCPYDYNGRGEWKSECTAELATDALALLKEQPEIVRCRECKSYKPYIGRVSGNQYFECECFDMDIDDPDWFCANGERRVAEDD